MNIETETPENEAELVLDTPLEEGAQSEAPQGEAADEELSLEIEGEEAADETPLIRQLRSELRDSKRELAEHRKAQAPAAIDPGPKPTLEGCEWDEDKFEAALTKWHDTKRQADNSQREQAERAEVQNREFERLKISHRQRAEALGIKDFDEAEKAVVDALGAELAGAALIMADDSAKLVGALGKNPAVLAKIAAEPNPLLKLKMLMKVESKIVVNKKKPPSPEAETIQRGSAALSVGGDKVLAQLEKEADRTGNRTKVIAYKRNLAQKAA